MAHREVTKDEFYAAIAHMDVHPTPVGKYPYVSIFKAKDGKEVGRIDQQNRYFLEEP